MLAKLHWQRKNSFQEGMHDPKWIQCHLKKEKKTNLHFCSSNIIKRTRTVTRLALNLQGWVHGALQHSKGTRVSQDTGCVPVLPRHSSGSEAATLILFPARQTDASLFCCLSSAIIWACWIHLASNLHDVFGPRHTWVLFSPFFQTHALHLSNKLHQAVVNERLLCSSGVVMQYEAGGQSTLPPEKCGNPVEMHRVGYLLLKQNL